MKLIFNVSKILNNRVFMNFQILKKFFTQRNKTKSIYKYINEPVKTINYDILNYGYPESRYLRQPADIEITNINNSIIKEIINSLKATASLHNVFSLSATQIKKEFRIFCYYKYLSLNKWINRDLSIKLNPEDYYICINPTIISASHVTHTEYEECSSFKLLKANAKRPLAITARFQDENGKTQEKELIDFEARVFCHEYDHLSGIPFIHWRVCEGDIVIKDDYINENDKYENLFYAIDYYKNRIKEAKLFYPNLFDNDSESPDLINRVTSLESKNNQIIYNYYNTNRNKRLSFEDIMLIDIEKGIRKDLKLKLRRETAEKK